MRPWRSSVRTIWWTEGRRDPEVALHVGFGGRLFVDGRVGVNEGEILALLFGEARPRKGVTRDRVSIHQG